MSSMQDYLKRILEAKEGLLEYDKVTGGLRVWPWPIDKRQERVALYNLADHRASHSLQNPCCLCAHLEESDVTETAIIMADDGPYRGFWVAICAQSQCGYFAPLDNIYVREGIATKFYPCRAPPPVFARFHTSRNDGLSSRLERPAKRVHVAGLPRFDPPPNAALCTTTLLNRLDCWLRPGLTVQQFRELFAQCECGMVTTCRMFGRHECIPRKKLLAMVDLTADEANMIADD